MGALGIPEGFVGWRQQEPCWACFLQIQGISSHMLWGCGN